MLKGTARRNLSGAHCALGLAAVAWMGFAASPAAAQIRWRSGASPHSGRTHAQAVQSIAAEGERDAARHMVAQFSRPVTPEDRAALDFAGVTLLSYLGDNAFFVAVDRTRLDTERLAEVDSLSDAQAPRTAWKQHPVLAAGALPDWAVVPAPADAADAQETWIGAYVLLHGDVGLDEGVEVVERLGYVVRDQLYTVNGLVIEMPLGGANTLAGQDAVMYVEPALPRMSENNDSNRVITQANIVQAAPYGLTGAGVKVLVYDGGTAAAGHADFQGRLVSRDGSGVIDHATHVAGTVGGGGVVNPNLKGMAPGVTIESYGFQTDGSGTFLYTNPGDIQADYNQAINTHGAVISNNSIGTNTAANGFPCDIEGDYGVTDTVIDAIVRGSLGAPFRIVWANGNERGNGRCGTQYHTTAPPACAKNHITVGAMNSNDDSVTSFTSWGPADDGRLKPDVSAPGCQSGGDGGVTSCAAGGGYTVFCGTSMASPTACGLSALLMQDFRAQFPGEPDFRNSTLKILLAHNAQDIQNVGPDYQTGYGSVRIQRTVDFMRTGNFLENQVAHGASYNVLVPVSAFTPQLKVTLAWDDPVGTPNVIPSLINDLDLRVFDPSNNQRFPWTLGGLANPSAPAVQTVADHLNNIEQVVVNSPAVGTWRVEVFGFNVPQGPQPFSLCASPLIVNCSSAGVVALGQSSYACTDTVEVRAVDCDLNANSGAVETVNLNLASTTEPGGETILLTETGADTADFRANASINPVNAPGVVQVSPGDTLTATYIDADDGLGGTNVPRTSNAAIDCQGPVISNVQVPFVSSNNATITFTTDEPADGTIRYGFSCGSLGQSASEGVLRTAHTVDLTGLTDGTQYFFAVDAEDQHGNAATDDNGGSCYSFTTADVIFDFPLNVNPGWTLQGQWAYGVPTGGGSSNRDPTSGFTGANVLGYNLAGDYPDNLPATYLTTTALDCSAVSNTTLSFRRWLGVESNSNFDQATVEVSNDGSNYIVVFRATDGGVDIADTSWQLQEFDISAIADGQPTVFIRWGMGPTDTNVTFPGWNLDDIQILGVALPISITFPDGLPTALAPGMPTNFRVQIDNNTESYVPGTGVLRYRYSGGAFQSAALTPLGGNLYQATLPSTVCASDPQFFVSAQASGGSTVSNPATAPASFHLAAMGSQVTPLNDTFETNLGWTVGDVGDNATTGLWTRVNPVGTAAQPEDDHTVAGTLCFVTGQGVVGGGLGDNDVDGGKTTLVSPVFSLAGTTDARISYWRWYSNNTGGAPNADTFRVSVSNDNGGSWTAVETVGPGGPEVVGGWFFHEFNVADIIAPTAQMKMRFVADDAATPSLIEAGLDDFTATGFVCNDLPQGCCWKCEGGTLICSSPTFQADCPAGYTWVSSESCGTSACGAGQCGAPPAQLTGAVSRKACDLALTPGVASEPRQGGVTEVRMSFDIAPGGPGPSPVSVDEKFCPPPGAYAPYSGASTMAGSVTGNTLVVTFTPGLENGRTYRLTVGSDVSSLAGQFVEVRGLVGDVNSDGQTNATDRSVVVGVWTGAGFTCVTDLNGDAATNALDRSVVVGAWTGGTNCAP